MCIIHKSFETFTNCLTSPVGIINSTHIELIIEPFFLVVLEFVNSGDTRLNRFYQLNYKLELGLVSPEPQTHISIRQLSINDRDLLF